MRITLLCGGVGGSKLALGLYTEFPDADLRVIVNTGDDLTVVGLHVSPDIDTVTYTLAGLANPDTGWGLLGDTFTGLEMLRRYGHDTWFQLGDRDIATHLARTEMLSEGKSLTEATSAIASALGVRALPFPMCNEPVATMIRVDDGWLDFQTYFVRRHFSDEPLGVEHVGVENARATAETVDAISAADVIVIAPSNPVVSIGPILHVPGVLDAIRAASAPTVAVSPFIGSQSITGPADALMRAIGFEPTAHGLAQMYGDWLDTLVIHDSDAEAKDAIEAVGPSVAMCDVMMPDDTAKRRLARFVVSLA